MEDFNYDALEKEVNQYKPEQSQTQETTNTTQEKKSFNGQKNFQKKETFNGWKDITIKEVNPVELPLNNVNKVYTIYSDYRNLSTEVQNKFISLISLLSKNGYTCRIGFPGDTPMAKTLESMEGVSFECYLPFKKYNENIYTVGSVPQDKLPYQISRYVIKNGYDKIPDIVRAFRANAVQLMLSRTCLLPTNFVVISTKCGTTKVDAKTDFKQCDFPGSTLLVIKLANMLKIPVINLGKATWSEDLKRVVTGDKPSEQPKTTEVKVEETIKTTEEDVPLTGETPTVVEEVTSNVSINGESLPPQTVEISNEVDLTDFI